VNLFNIKRFISGVCRPHRWVISNLWLANPNERSKHKGVLRAWMHNCWYFRSYDTAWCLV